MNGSAAGSSAPPSSSSEVERHPNIIQPHKPEPHPPKWAQLVEKSAFT